MTYTNKPYRIIGAYDSETTNYEIDGSKIAFPILHQIGLLDGTPIIEIDNSNVEEHVQIELYRHTLELYERLDEMVSAGSDYVPVIMCHNLSFDMYGLSSWLKRQNVKVLAKSARKPITFTVLDESGNPALVIWDTLIFTQQGLERMGEDCGYSKGVGEWDYDLIRAPDTPLSETELDYAKRDIFTLVTWVGWWLRRNPDIMPERLGLNVVTKTGIVRERRRVRFESVRGNGQKQSMGNYWLYRAREEAPKTDDELFTMIACTRGGFTFCASTAASIPYNLTGTDCTVLGVDATSQHPAQLVSHKYPYGFREMTTRVLDLAFSLIGKVKVERILALWDKPFPVAFYAAFKFKKLRPRMGSVFERYGIFPIASARFRTPEQIAYEENGDKAAHDQYMYERDYHDSCINGKFAFGKVVSADVATLYLTELAAWEVWQAYEWDSVEAIHGYETGKFIRPNDYDVVSTMQFYQAKNEYKVARGEYYDTGTITNGSKLKELGIAPAIVSSMETGALSAGDVEATYLSLKADLNALFGINASNEYRRDTVLADTGIEYEGKFGVCNKPKHPKVWYQFGQRIVGWSRIAQVVAMMLCAPYVSQIINGDTDSLKFVVLDSEKPKVFEQLYRMAKALDAGKDKVCSRVKTVYPRFYDDLCGIGHYVSEFEVKRFCASWNKAYCEYDKGFSFTLAGIPTRKRQGKKSSFIGINGLADRLYALGMSFEEICNIFLGYNTTFAHDVIRLNGRKFPEWGTYVYTPIVDYMGKSHKVAEPAALALFPMSKTINNTSNHDNSVNLRYALENNPDVSSTPTLVYSGGILDLEGIADEIL